MILPLCQKQAKADSDNSFINTVDIDVVTAFASLLYQLADINALVVLQSRHLDNLVNLMTQSASQVQESTLQKEVIRLLLIIVQSSLR